MFIAQNLHNKRKASLKKVKVNLKTFDVIDYQLMSSFLRGYMQYPRAGVICKSKTMNEYKMALRLKNVDLKILLALDSMEQIYNFIERYKC